ncbi:MAG TPA: MaoC family dehydratase [Jiangellales bacterium]|nr:MaoC family dehydratase [Jiangellales bacterium]
MSTAERSDAWGGQPAPRVGDHAGRVLEITPEHIELFTRMSGDRNPLHYDADLAARTPFGRVVVQGGVTTGILNATVAEELPGPGSVFLHTDWSFRAPVRPGDTITGHVEVLEVRTDKPICRLRTTVTRDDGTVAVEGEALTWTFRP